MASTGHSLGGNLSGYFTIQAANTGFSKKITQSVNFDGPGFSKEFLEKNKKQIDSMSEIMKHYQWSAVGNLLFSVPGVEFVTTDIKDYSDTSTYLQNDFDKEYLYNLICRHDTRSLKYDEHGNLVNGKRDNLAWFMGKLSKLIDRMPSSIGNSMKDSLTYFLLHGEEIKSLFVDDNGLTTLGKSLVAAAAVTFRTFFVKETVNRVFFRRILEQGGDDLKQCLAKPCRTDFGSSVAFGVVLARLVDTRINAGKCS